MLEGQDEDLALVPMKTTAVLDLRTVIDVSQGVKQPQG